MRLLAAVAAVGWIGLLAARPTVAADRGEGSGPGLRIEDAPDVTEGSGVSASFDVVLTQALGNVVTVRFDTFPAGATPDVDYIPVSGTLTFLPGETLHTISVPIIDDDIGEFTEFVSMVLSSATGAPILNGVAYAAILDDDFPRVSISDCTAVEGNSGTTPCQFTVTLAHAVSQPFQVSVGSCCYGTAISGQDYTFTTGVLTFPPGTVSQTIDATVLGDTVSEGDEYFRVSVTAAPTVIIVDGEGKGTIVDDDPRPTTLELSHGYDQLRTLAGTATPGSELFLLQQEPGSSYEVVVDATSGDLAPPVLERLAPGGTVVLQVGTPVGAGSSMSLRFENLGDLPVSGQLIRVRSSGCSADCGPDDVYRIRAYDTTYRATRYNNTGTQVTVGIIHNTTSYPVHFTVHVWSIDGSTNPGPSETLGPQATFVMMPFGPAGGQGSVTVSSDGSYGDLVGKAVALEPATGFSFDTPLEPRPH